MSEAKPASRPLCWLALCGGDNEVRSRWVAVFELSGSHQPRTVTVIPGSNVGPVALAPWYRHVDTRRILQLRHARRLSRLRSPEYDDRLYPRRPKAFRGTGASEPTQPYRLRPIAEELSRTCRAPTLSLADRDTAPAAGDERVRSAISCRRTPPMTPSTEVRDGARKPSSTGTIARPACCWWRARTHTGSRGNRRGRRLSGGMH